VQGSLWTGERMRAASWGPCAAVEFTPVEKGDLAAAESSGRVAETAPGKGFPAAKMT